MTGAFAPSNQSFIRLKPVPRLTFQAIAYAGLSPSPSYGRCLKKKRELHRIFGAFLFFQRLNQKFQAQNQPYPRYTR